MKPHAFVDLPPDAYPFALEFYDVATKEVLHRIEVDGPGAVHIPGLRKPDGPPVGMRVIYSDGEVVDTEE